ncbi:unnamed protein product [Rotaria magnacalcarata]|uniref:SAM-dependent MTase TRM10-type domain-containing protein n=2 Tax=Rotaria magnacalcarata TaxID=392030 RepID=A0A8S2TXU4_9BILA|nr:unnamed protein product [Rotaria magnacalcarata]
MSTAVEEETSSTTNDVESTVKVSKNQQRKQKRYELMLERRKSKRKEEKAKQKQRRIDKIRKAEDPSLLTRHGLKSNRMENSSCRIRICIDCRYDSMMSDKDVGSLQKQIAFCYSANRRALAPCQFYVTNIDGQLDKRLEKNSAKNWDIHLRNEPLEQVFPHEDILYLTSESENVLSSTEPLDERTVYVIGGIVDHNSRKGLCYQLALQNKWRHARLPIDEFIKMNTRRVLACNHVHNNQLTTLPDAMRGLRALEKLVLSQNQLTILPDGFYFCSSLLSLNLSRNRLTKLSNKIGQLSYLQELDLSENEFELFPKEIGFLTKLTKLTVAKNRLRALPHEFGALYNLRSLDLSHNQLTQLPESFGDLINLEEIYVNANRLTIFPCFNQCSRLKEIHMADNQLTEITDNQLTALLTLISLNLRGNKIHTLPDQIALLPNLERLDVTNNDLSDLPSKIALNKKIKNISMTGNPLGKIRKDVIRLGTDSIMKYLRNRLTIDDGTASSTEQQTFDIPKSTETDDERKRRLYTEHHVVRTTGTFDYSHKNVSTLSNESIELIIKEKPTHVNLAKNKFTEMPIE